MNNLTTAILASAMLSAAMNSSVLNMSFLSTASKNRCRNMRNEGKQEENYLHSKPGSKFNKDCNINKSATIMNGKYTVKPSRKVRPWSSK